MFDGPAWIEVRNRLVEEHLAWAHEIAARVARRLPTWFVADDLTAAAEIALVKLSDDYRSYQAVPFKAFAIRRLRGACYDAARRREYRERGHLELTDRHVDTSASPERLAELSEMESVWAHVDKLPECHRAVIIALFRDEKTGVQVGEELGIRKARASQLRAEALKMLKQMLAGDQ